MRSTLALVPVVIALSACSDTVLHTKIPSSIDTPPGAITGRVCSADGRSWLADAQVYTNVVSAEGELLTTVLAYTDLDGRFTLEDLPGDQDYTVYIAHGSDSFEPQDTYVPGGDTVELPEPDCFDPLTVDVAVITGDYDNFERVLANMGFANYTLVDGLDQSELQAFLLNDEELAQFDIIFINGGALEDGILTSDDSAMSAQIVSNLQGYVSAGGQIYASDWAYDYVETAWPEAMEFVGDDGVIDDAQVGEYGLVNAAVTDSAMASWLGTDYVEIEYDLPVWAPIESVGGGVSVHLSGSVEYREGTSSYTLSSVPLLASFTSGEGRVTYATFRVAPNASTDMMLVLQYMIYNL